MEKSLINNDFYDELATSWYEGEDHPAALLRAENALRNPWILKVLLRYHAHESPILDIGCGAGILANFLSSQGCKSVTGCDLSKNSLLEAEKRDTLSQVHYQQADAASLPFTEKSFKVVTAMDLLEHVQQPQRVIQEAARVLDEGGLFFFHTFSRTFLSWLMVIKGVEWFVKNTPPHMHAYSLFIQPEELAQMLQAVGLQLVEIHGVRPVFLQKPMLKMLLTKRVSSNFRFRFASSLLTGYCGYAIKSG